jgi:hypothetical protein
LQSLGPYFIARERHQRTASTPRTPHVATLTALHGYHGGAPPLVVEAVGGRLPSTVLLHHVAVRGALELARLTEAQERERRLGANLLTRLLDQRIDPQAAQLQLAEAVQEARWALAVAAATGQPNVHHGTSR